MLGLEITPEAESDLVDIWVYTCNEWGVDQADKYLDQLERGINQLIDYPELGLDYSHVLPGYRQLHQEHHLVFYRLEKHYILIVRVLHENIDAPRRLAE
ncbi:type II toxin-antitoxin system RelE/ParE family toxin [Zhongshania arctica]|uniref:Toxin n=1 Tax=Zhongshania arctica TaxID=3238302 RepID=A0ABV3TYD2_9GAMM